MPRAGLPEQSKCSKYRAEKKSKWGVTSHDGGVRAMETTFMLFASEGQLQELWWSLVGYALPLQTNSAREQALSPHSGLQAAALLVNPLFCWVTDLFVRLKGSQSQILGASKEKKFNRVELPRTFPFYSCVLERSSSLSLSDPRTQHGGAATSGHKQGIADKPCSDHTLWERCDRSCAQCRTRSHHLPRKPGSLWLVGQ